METDAPLFDARDPGRYPAVEIETPDRAGPAEVVARATASTAPPTRNPFIGLLRRAFSRAFPQIAVAFAITFGAMSWIEFAGPAILDNDGYYHIRWSRMLREAAPALPPFKVLPLTTLNERDYVDHHYLFHLMLAPFTFGDMRVGAKLAAAIFSSLGLTALFALLVVWRVPFRWFWLVPLIASSEPFLYRMSMTRAPSLSVAFLGVGAYLMLRQKLAWLAALSFAFVWFYSLFPLILAFAAALAVAVYLTERRVDVRALAASSLGVLAGLLINPYFPQNLFLFRDHLLMKATASYSVNVGVEWYPYYSWDLLGGSAVAFAIYFAALVGFKSGRARRNLRPLFFLLVATMFLLLAFKSRRFIEYWPPFAVIFGAFALAPYLARASRARIPEASDRAIAALASAALLVASFAAMGAVMLQAHASIKSEADPYAYQGASLWLAEHAEPGSVVFNTDWDDFPMLFYYNPNNAYVVGLDPTYLYEADPQLWKLYERVTLGDESDPAPIIRDRFGAKYVFTDNDHTAFLSAAAISGDFETVYKDRFTTVLRLLGEDDAPPPPSRPE
ncbi:MAG TPA: hypothetical protein VKC34_00530 [Blastocatellia bacterium]|nr:hypothetical protein [Blastocatellia bacterium]